MTESAGSGNRALSSRYRLSADRREIPEGSGAAACVGLSWERIIELLAAPLGDAAPEIVKRQTIWLLRARPNGMRIEFFDDEAAFRRRLADHTADLADGPQVHAGRLTWA